MRVRVATRPEAEVEQLDMRNGIRIKPAELVEEWERLAFNIRKKWPKTLSSVEAIREEREKLEMREFDSRDC